MNYSRPWMFCGLAMMVAGAVLLWQQGNFYAGQLAEDAPEDRETERAESRKKEPPPAAWKKLFDGKTLKGWKTAQFGGEGNVQIRDGAIVMEMGSMMTGVTWTGKPPRNNYELALEGIRLDGNDFFCTTTFPVGDEHCSLVVGGWGGILVGLSNVDRFDASENQTSTTYDFDDKKWYRIRIRVTDAAIEAWIDDNRVVNQPRKGHTFGIRDEVDLCRPLGICTWCTKGAVRNIRLRELRRVGQAKRGPTSSEN